MSSFCRPFRWSEVDIDEPFDAADYVHWPASEDRDPDGESAVLMGDEELSRLGLSALFPLSARCHPQTLTWRDMLPCIEVIPGPAPTDRKNLQALVQQEEPRSVRHAEETVGSSFTVLAPMSVTVDLGVLVAAHTRTGSGTVRRFALKSQIPCSFYIRSYCREGDRCAWSHNVAQLSSLRNEGRARRQRIKRARALEKNAGHPELYMV